MCFLDRRDGSLVVQADAETQLQVEKIWQRLDQPRMPTGKIQLVAGWQDTAPASHVLKHLAPTEF